MRVVDLDARAAHVDEFEARLPGRHRLAVLTQRPTWHERAMADDDAAGAGTVGIRVDAVAVVGVVTAHVVVAVDGLAFVTVFAGVTVGICGGLDAHRTSGHEQAVEYQRGTGCQPCLHRVGPAGITVEQPQHGASSRCRGEGEFLPRPDVELDRRGEHIGGVQLDQRPPGTGVMPPREC